MQSREEVTQQITPNDIIDIHTHAGADNGNILFTRYPSVQSVKDLVMKMELSDVNYAVTFPCATSYYYYNLKAFRERYDLITDPNESFPYEAANKSLIYEIEAFGDGRILPFAIILPGEKEDSQYDYLKDLAEQGILFGLKMHSLAIHKSPLDLIGTKFMDLLGEYDLPILFHTGPDSDSDAMKVIKLAEQYPHIRMCIAHAADCRVEVFQRLQEGDLPNVFTDTSPFITMCHVLPTHIEQGKGGKKFDFPYKNGLSETLVKIYQQYPQGVMWGTDEPWTSLVKADENGKPKVIARVNYSDEVDLLRSLPAEIVQNIAHKNSLRFLFDKEL